MRAKSAGFASVVVVFGVLIGCARQPMATEQAGATTTAPLPFDQSANDKGVSPTGPLTPQNIPAGTPITVRLRSSVSSQTSRSGESFDGVLDDPIIVDGQTIAARGSEVSGRVVEAKAAGRMRDPGYLRLTLSSLSLVGKTVALQTSCIFAKGSSQGKLMKIGAADAFASGRKDVEFSSDRRLTFRVTKPVSL